MGQNTKFESDPSRVIEPVKLRSDGVGDMTSARKLKNESRRCTQDSGQLTKKKCVGTAE